MAQYRIGEVSLDLEVVGVGLQNGTLPPALAEFAHDVKELLSSGERETDDLNAFLASGWQFRTGKEIDWEEVIAYNRGADIEPGLLARYPGGGLVIIRNRVVLKLKPSLEPEKINEVVPEANRVRITPLRFGVNLFEVVLKIPELNLDLEEALLKAISSLTANRNVLFCEPTLFYHARTWENQRKESVELRKFGMAKKDDELYQWHWDKIELPKAWQTTRGKGTRVAVIDHGFFDEDVEIIPVTWKALLSQDGNYVGPGPLPRDSHGTFCAGLVGAHDDGKGVHGAAPECGLVLIAIQNPRVLSQVALGNALRLCVQGPNGKPEAEGADIICCSLGLNANNWILETGLKEAIDYAHHDGRPGRNGNRGAVIVWATFDQNDPICPNTVEDYRDLIIVSQSDEQDRRRQSGYGAALDLIAPGFWVLGLDYDHQIRGIDTEQGSSFAAPCVAGVAALVLAVNSNLTWQQVAEVLTTTCDPDVKPKVRIDDYVGWGRLNARCAVVMAISMKPGGKILKGLRFIKRWLSG